MAHELVLATDIGMVVASAASPMSWYRLGSLPHAVVNNVRVIPGTNSVLAATHGRGLWRVDLL